MYIANAPLVKKEGLRKEGLCACSQPQKDARWRHQKTAVATDRDGKGERRRTAFCRAAQNSLNAMDTFHLLPRSFLGMRARAEPFFPEPFLLDKRRVGFMRRANFLGDRRFLDLVGIMLL